MSVPDPGASDSQKTKTVIEKVKDKLPEITAILIILGFMDIHFYYSRFGINIYPYLDASEIIFPFAGLVIVTIPILFYVGVLVLGVTEEGGGVYIKDNYEASWQISWKEFWQFTNKEARKLKRLYPSIHD